LIVSIEVVNTNNDKEQFTKQVREANEILGRKCETACADARYANTDQRLVKREVMKNDASGFRPKRPAYRQAGYRNDRVVNVCVLLQNCDTVCSRV
jgi:hypothetical protein